MDVYEQLEHCRKSLELATDELRAAQYEVERAAAIVAELTETQGELIANNGPLFGEN